MRSQWVFCQNQSEVHVLKSLHSRFHSAVKMAAKDRLENVNPHIFAKAGQRLESPTDWDDDVYDPFDSREVFDLVRNIRDPEHPLSLEELNVVS